MSPAINESKSVDNSLKIVDKSNDSNLKSETLEANRSLSPKISGMTGNSDSPNGQKDIRVNSVPQQMSSQNSGNNCIRFQLSKQSTNVNKCLNNSFDTKIQSIKAKESNRSPNSYSKADDTQTRPQSSSSGETPPDQWPESLREYVNRAFSACTNELDKDRIEIILKGKLTKAHHEGVLFTKDWSAEPLPQLSSPKSLNNYNSKQNSHSAAIKDTDLKNKQMERKRRPRSRESSNSPEFYDSESNSSSDRFRDRKKKQKKLSERYVLYLTFANIYLQL